MSENEVIPMTGTGAYPTACGDYGPVQVEMHDTLGVIALAIVSLLLFRALLKEQARNRALAQLLLQQGEVD